MAVNLIPNVYAHYKLNESSGILVSDSSVHGRDGTTVNMEDGDWVAGKLNNCLLFDGVNEYVNCQNIAGFERDDAFSLECWVKYTDAGYLQILSKQHIATNYRGWSLWSNGGKLFFALNYNNTTNKLYKKTSTTHNDNSWHHIIITYDGTITLNGLTIYVDNNIQPIEASANTLTATIINDANCQISGRNGIDGCFDGLMDEVVIYDKELSVEEIAFRWNGGAGTEEMVEVPPTAPSNPDPSDTATDIDYNQNLDWDCPDADTYDIYLGTSSPPSVVESDHPSSDYTIPYNLDSCTLYYWKIVAKNEAGETSGPEWSFTTNNALPTIPNTPSPIYGAVGQNLSLILEWECEDYNPNDTLVYDIYFGALTPPPLVKSNHSSRQYNVSGLDNNKKYYWKIVARDDASCGTHETISPIWEFTTKSYVTGGYEAFDPRKIIIAQFATMHKIDNEIKECIRVTDNNNKFIYIPMYVEEEAELDNPPLPTIRLDLLAIKAVPHNIKASVRQHTALIGIDIEFDDMDNIDVTNFGKKVADRIVDLCRYYQSDTGGIDFYNIFNQGRLIIENRHNEVIFHWMLELEATFSDAC